MAKLVKDEDKEHLHHLLGQWYDARAQRDRASSKPRSPDRATTATTRKRLPTSKRSSNGPSRLRS
ncbi:hypothetical protein Micbo1qcDRAFT_170036 [Microdochium bolleyi]|uniref:Uncharacterized protein n=1 Tax=Microdochium bolleyi TaxID=196109 RepID=A0A136IIB1_9PEZI|nr:hypothetical protein Micbo1qcDRAFT_170036 [Microdochium bolleyi]